MDLSTMSAAEIEAHIHELDAQIAALRQQKLDAQRVLGATLTRARMEGLAAALSDAERAMLVQTIQNEGIESAERVGKTDTA